MTLTKIISGGQTGTDRGALDAALSRSFSCGGWCPRGRRAEDGVIPSQYPLEEASSPTYPERTRLNIEHSDGTLIVCRGLLSGGTLLTRSICLQLGKWYFVADLDYPPMCTGLVMDWLTHCNISVCNVAGPRESKQPGIQADAALFVGELLDREMALAQGKPDPMGPSESKAAEWMERKRRNFREMNGSQDGHG